jgi:hypothetical protein
MKSLKNKILHKTVSGVELRRLVLLEKWKYVSIEVDTGVYPLYHTTMQMYHSLKLLKNEITKT